MKTHSKLNLTAAVLSLALFTRAEAVTAYALTPTGLLEFDTANPSSITNSSTFSGLTSGDSITDIDFRPQNGTLYGIAQTGRLYRINPITGAVIADSSGAMGTVEKADFNPVANRLRVFSSGDQNYRITQGTGLVTFDGTLAFAAADVNFGVNPILGSAAYLNNFVGAAATTLYSIDSNLDILISHSGGPQFSTLNTIGSLGLDVGPALGFDIVDTDNKAFVSNGQNLYSINLANGMLSGLGTIGGSGVIGLAVVPEPTIAGFSLISTVMLLVRRRRNARA